MEGRCRFFTKWVVIMFIVNNITVTTSPSIIHSIFCMMNGNFDTSKWLLYLQISVPFDRSNVSTWYFCLLLQVLSLVGPILTIATTFTYFASCCFYINACFEHLRFFLHQIDEIHVVYSKNMANNVIETNKKLTDAIFLHLKIIELVA